MGIISNLYVKLGLKNSQFNSGLKDSEKKVGVFGNTIKKIGGLVAGAFAVSSIISFGKELVVLSGQAQGVVSAFSKLENSEKILNDLEQATRGTVSKLELMKRVIQARNFNIPLDQLATLFKFATNRAIETGESVDYLVDSIVTGLGRKSVLILDNLGISAAELQDEIKKVGDFSQAAANIIDRELTKAGDVASTTATEVAGLVSEWENFKLSLSTSPEFIDFVKGSLEELKDVITIMTSDLSTWRKTVTFLFGSTDKWSDLASEIRESDTSIKGGIDTVEQFTDSYEDLEKQLDAIIPKFKKLGSSVSSTKKESIVSSTKRESTPERMTSRGLEPFIANDSLADMTSFYDRMSEQLANFKEDYFGDWVNFNNELNAIIEYGIEDAITVLAEGFGRLASGDINLDEFFDGILNQLGQFLQAFGSALIAYGIASDAFTKAFQNPAVAIAAGVALVAIGGFISGLGSRGPQGYSGGSSGTVSGVNVITTNQHDQQLVAKVTGNQLDFVLSKYNRDQSNI